MSMERRPITAAPGHEIDRAGQVFRIAGGQAVPIPANDRGIVRLRVADTSVITADRRTLLAVAFPEVTEAEMPPPSPARFDPEPGEAEAEPKTQPKRRRGGSRPRSSSDDA